eukprot:gb/GECH01014390.1/.p1 GENE.gb/GECH01014390.1/~~gb/GECH01014390.1/.p1  ORF type:complete len:515 (+),score=92.77 gb/GECH01014390.1/:1-1545(+)
MQYEDVNSIHETENDATEFDFETENAFVESNSTETFFNLSQNLGGLYGFDETMTNAYKFVHEPPEVPLIRRHRLKFIYFINLIVALENTIIIPTIWPYIESLLRINFEGSESSSDDSVSMWGLSIGREILVGICLSIYALAAFIFNPVMAFVSTKINYKFVYCISLLISMSGNLIYAFAANVYMIIGGRFLAGIGAGCVGASFTYVRSVTTTQERTPKIINLKMFGNFGLLFGPAISLVITAFWKFIFVEDNDESFAHLGHAVVSDATIVGYFSSILCFTCALLSLFFVHEPKIFANESKGKARISWQMWLLLIVNFCVSFVLMSFQTIVTPLTDKNFEWKGFSNSLLFLGISLLSIPSVIGVKITSKFTNDRIALLVGLFIFTGGLGFDYADSQMALFITGIVPFTIGVSFINTMIPAVYSKVMSPQNRSAAMSYVPAAMSLARIFGPFVGGTLLDIAPVWVVITAMILMGGGCFLACLISYKKLAPWQDQTSEKTKDLNEKFINDDDSKETQ